MNSSISKRHTIATQPTKVFDFAGFSLLRLLLNGCCEWTPILAQAQAHPDPRHNAGIAYSSHRFRTPYRRPSGWEEGRVGNGPVLKVIQYPGPVYNWVSATKLSPLEKLLRLSMLSVHGKVTLTVTFFVSSVMGS